MEQANDPATADPPAYTATVPALPTTTQRTIQDTRALILANASIIKPRAKGDEPIELILGKTKSLAEIAAAAEANSRSRSFTSQLSNVTIRISDSPAAAPSSGSTPERRPSEVPAARAAGRHYAVLVYRIGVGGLNILLKGEPQETVEEALEWMLDKTEMAVTDILLRRWPEMGEI